MVTKRNYTNKLGELFKSIRSEHNYSQEEFAKLFGWTSRNSVCRIEYGYDLVSKDQLNIIIETLRKERSIDIGMAKKMRSAHRYDLRVVFKIKHDAIVMLPHNFVGKVFIGNKEVKMK